MEKCQQLFESSIHKAKFMLGAISEWLRAASSLVSFRAGCVLCGSGFCFWCVKEKRVCDLEILGVVVLLGYVRVVLCVGC